MRAALGSLVIGVFASGRYPGCFWVTTSTSDWGTLGAVDSVLVSPQVFSSVVCREGRLRFFIMAFLISNNS